MSGRGRGRGRGRGGGGPQFVARDEDGNVVFNKKFEGPPPLYPKVEQLPDLPTITARDEMLVKRRRNLELAWNSSPYYIEKAKAKCDRSSFCRIYMQEAVDSMRTNWLMRPNGIAAEIERYSDRYRTDIRANRSPLNSVLKLAPGFFPAELLGQGRGRGKGTPLGSAQWTLQTSLAKSDLHRLDQLASLEQRRQKDEDKEVKEGEEKKPGEGEEGDGENEELEDEEEEFGDDDYAQAYGFDDDEEYDVDDGGDDEGPTY